MASRDSTGLFAPAANLDGLRQYSLVGPSEVAPLSKDRPSYANLIRPIRDAHGLAIVREKVRTSPISGLFGTCSPFAIAGFIVSIVVDAFDLILFGRSSSNVRKEILKRRSPAMANSDTLTAVSWIANVTRCFASPDHRTPATVSDRIPLTMSSAPLDCCLPSEATAASLDASRKTRAVRQRFSTAGALAPPDQQSVFVSSGEFNHCESFKLLSDGDVTCVSPERRLFGFRLVDDWLYVLWHGLNLSVCCVLRIVYPRHSRSQYHG